MVDHAFCPSYSINSAHESSWLPKGKDYPFVGVKDMSNMQWHRVVFSQYGKSVYQPPLAACNVNVYTPTHGFRAGPDVRHLQFDGSISLLLAEFNATGFSYERDHGPIKATYENGWEAFLKFMEVVEKSRAFRHTFKSRLEVRYP